MRERLVAGLGCIVVGLVWLVAWLNPPSSDDGDQSEYMREYMRLMMRGAPVIGPFLMLLGMWLVITNWN